MWQRNVRQIGLFLENYTWRYVRMCHVWCRLQKPIPPHWAQHTSRPHRKPSTITLLGSSCLGHKYARSTNRAHTLTQFMYFKIFICIIVLGRFFDDGFAFDVHAMEKWVLHEIKSQRLYKLVSMFVISHSRKRFFGSWEHNANGRCSWNSVKFIFCLLS